MKKNLEIIIVLTLLIAGFALMIWGSFIMRNYDGYLEIIREARRAAAPQYYSGIIILVGTYIYFTITSKKK